MIPIGLVLEPPAPEAANAVDDLVARAGQAADAGVASLWLAQMYDIDALTAIALIGRQVPGVTLGTAVTTIHSRHPIAMSSQAKTAQAACGRLVLGLGTGHRATVEQRYGYSFDSPAKRVREYLAVLLPLLRDEEVSYRGQSVTADTTGWPTRVAGSTQPPVLLAALGSLMLRVAGEAADGTITWLAGPRTLDGHITPAITAAASQRRAPQIVACLPVCLTSEPDAVRDRAAAALAFYANVPSYRAVLEREDAKSPADVAVIGTERDIERAVTRLADVGATHLVANLAMFTTSEERTRTIEFLGSLSSPTRLPCLSILSAGSHRGGKERGGGDQAGGDVPPGEVEEAAGEAVHDGGDGRLVGGWLLAREGGLRPGERDDGGQHGGGGGKGQGEQGAAAPRRDQ